MYYYFLKELQKNKTTKGQRNLFGFLLKAKNKNKRNNRKQKKHYKHLRLKREIFVEFLGFATFFERLQLKHKDERNSK